MCVLLFGAQLDKLIVGGVYNSLQCSGLVDAAGSQLQKKEKDMNTHTQSNSICSLNDVALF